jgi:hypothetical protein
VHAIRGDWQLERCFCPFETKIVRVAATSKGVRRDRQCRGISRAPFLTEISSRERELLIFKAHLENEIAGRWQRDPKAPSGHGAMPHPGRDMGIGPVGDPGNR